MKGTSKPSKKTFNGGTTMKRLTPAIALVRSVFPQPGDNRAVGGKLSFVNALLPSTALKERIFRFPFTFVLSYV